MRKLSEIVCAAAVISACAGTAQAQSFGVEEIRGGIFAHSVDEPGPGHAFWNFSRIEDANVELVFSPPGDALWWLGSPRPHVGATVNFGGLESMAYAGLTWTFQLFDSPLFVEGTFGAALHNGAANGAIAPARNLGCPLMFRESASLGYRVTEEASVMLTLEHASHAGLCGPDNRGLTNMGVRFGWTF